MKQIIVSMTDKQAEIFSVICRLRSENMQQMFHWVIFEYLNRYDLIPENDPEETYGDTGEQ